MTAPKFNRGEKLSAAKLNQLSKAAQGAAVHGGPGLHASQDSHGTTIRETRYRREMLARTGGAGYPASSATITINTEFPFEFVDIDHDLTPVVKERGDAAFHCYNLSLTHIAEDTLIVVFEHRGQWYTQTGGTGTGGSTSIYFSVVSVNCDAGGSRYITVQPNRIAPPCETVPDEDEYGYVDVYDNGFGCILNEYTDDELIGMNGKATYASAVDAGDYCVEGWTLDGLCDTGNC